MSKKLSKDYLSTATLVICLFAIFLSAFRIIYHLLTQSNGYLTVPQDDFYYYFITAKNILHYGKSSFDGITITNGFHPLWMVIVLSMEALSFGSDFFFFIEYTLICSLSCFFTYKLILAILRKSFSKSWFIYCTTILASVSYSWMIFWGMEITLTIPLYLYVINKIQNYDPRLFSKKEALQFGFISSLLILSRLDSITFVGLILIYFLLTKQNSLKEKWNFISSFILGGFLLGIYFAGNYLFSGSFLPFSAQAKGLKDTTTIGFPVLMEMKGSRDGAIAFYLLPIAFLLVTFMRKLFSQSKRHLLILVLAFPILYLIIFRTFSDWYLFAWYGFSIPIANSIALSSILFLAFRKIPSRFSTILGTLSTLAISILLFMPLLIRTMEGTVTWKPHPGSIYAHAKKIKEFTDTHPGLYAWETEQA